MEIEEFLKVVDLEGDLPVIPEVLTRVLTIVRSGHGSANELAQVILKDQALVTKLLKTANSSFYAHKGKAVSSVSQAIVVLGFDSVRDLAIGLSMFALLKNKKLEAYMTQFWVHAVACGVCAQAFSRAMNMEDQEEALVAGLLHDVGKLIMLRYFPDEFAEIHLLVDQGTPVNEAEEQVIGLRHQDVGEAVTLRWNLPPQTVRCIRHHHRFAEFRDDDYARQLANVVTLANVFAMHYYPSTAFSVKTSIENLCELAKEYLQMDEDVVRNTLKTLRHRVEEYLDIFEIGAPTKTGTDLETLDTATDVEANAQMKIYQLQQELGLKNTALRRVVEIGAAIVENVPLTELIETILEAIQASTGVDAVALALLNRNRGRIDGVAGVGYGVRPIVKKLHLPHARKDNLIARVIYDMKPINVLDIESPVYSKLLSEWERSVWGAPAFTICPIVSRGVGVGAIIADRRTTRRALTDSDVELITIFAGLVSAAIDRYRREAEAAAATSPANLAPAPR